MRALLVLLVLSGVVGAAIASRADRAGTGFLLGFFVGPVGLLLVWHLRSRWGRDRAAKAASQERDREEQAFREWRGH